MTKQLEPPSMQESLARIAAVLEWARETKLAEDAAVKANEEAWDAEAEADPSHPPFTTAPTGGDLARIADTLDRVLAIGGEIAKNMLDLVDVAQAAAEEEEEWLEEEEDDTLKRLTATLETFANYGTRHDLAPVGTGTLADYIEQLQAHIRSMDKEVRQRACAALGDAVPVKPLSQKEKTPYFDRRYATARECIPLGPWVDAPDHGEGAIARRTCNFMAEEDQPVPVVVIYPFVNTELPQVRWRCSGPIPVGDQQYNQERNEVARLVDVQLRRNGWLDEEKEP